MNLKNVLLLVAALGVAGMTALFANNWISAERAALLAMNKKAPEVQGNFVLVAAKSLSPGSFVRGGDLKWQSWPEDGLNESYALKGQKTIKDFEGAVIRAALAKGEPVTPARIVQPGDRGFLAAVVTPGKRAVSVPVNATTGIAGFIFPGDRVDVILTVRFKPEEENTRTRYFSETMLTGIRILAVDQKVDNENGKAAVAKTATLEVTAKQAEKIALGLNMGDLSLSLHSLARKAGRFRQLARDIGALAGEAPDSNNRRSYTMDSEIYFMRRDGGGDRVNVLRGGKAEQARF